MTTREQLWAVDPDAAEGQPVCSGSPDTTAHQGEISLGTEWGVIYQHQVGKIIFTDPDSGEIKVRPNVAIDDEEGIWSEQGQCPEDPAAGLHGRLLRRVANVEPPATAIAQYPGNLVAEMGVVDDQLPKPCSGKPLKVILDQGFAGDWQERFWGMVGEGSHAFTPSRGQNHGAQGRHPLARDGPPYTHEALHPPHRVACGLDGLINPSILEINNLIDSSLTVDDLIKLDCADWREITELFPEEMEPITQMMLEAEAAISETVKIH